MTWSVFLVLATCIARFADVTSAQSSSTKSSSESSVSTTANVLSAIGDPPAGCSTYRPETFGIVVFNATNAKVKKTLNALSIGPEPELLNTHVNQRRDNTILLNLIGGILVALTGEIGAVLTNGQLDLLDPTNSSQLYTRPFSICSNGSLALGSTAVWFQCPDGGLSNLHYFPLNTRCIQITIREVLINSSSTSTTPPATSTSTLNTSTAPTSIPSTTNAVPSSSTTPPAKTEPSNSGAIAGGVVGVLAGLALAISAIAFILLHRKKQRRQRLHPPRPVEMDAKMSCVGELDTTKPAAELHNIDISELHGSDVPELNGDRMRYY